MKNLCHDNTMVIKPAAVSIAVERVTMLEVGCWTVRLSVLLLLWSQLLDSQQTADHRKVPQTTESQQEFRAEYGEIQGAWGTWGAWSSCSRTCGKGVQEQMRPCLPVYTQSPPRGAAVQPQQPGHVISALKPVASTHHNGVRAFNSSSRVNLRREKQSRPGERRRVTHIVPGRYGYGRAPHVAPLLVDSSRGSGSPRLHRQRRSAAVNSLQLVARGHTDLRSHKLDASNNLHRFTRPYVHPRTQHQRNSQVWDSLYQPISANQAEVQAGSQTSSHQLHKERPYSPLPSSFCTGEHAHYRICNSNNCPPSSEDIRAVQCSSYNNQPFMGRLYKWEPFNEVPGGQHCELNCRAIGFRFYVRQSDRVIDGTPCGQNETHLCVAGRCTDPGSSSASH
ncbi:hypothetical protein ATANTOWER_016177 [Ataeniobius toweri]|uniref:Uncharacterized protein n=2 Tax=Goodeidae TaxID=28758 RepID=A0ABU7A2P7_9TELE|nr:hypothetical protein [Ataeniobius toweri]